MKFKQFQSCSKIPEILFCFDGQSNFLCPFFELSSFQYDISLPKEMVNRYSGKGLSFDDKKKILYHIFAGERLHEVPEIPWWALTLPQMVAFTQEKVENIYDEKVRALSYPHTWLATKLKSGCEFRKQFGSPPNFDYTVFGFSLKTPLDCSWSCIKTKENKQFNAQMKNYFAPLHQNILCQKPVTVNKKPSQKPRVSPPLANNPPVGMEMKKKKYLEDQHSKAVSSQKEQQEPSKKDSEEISCQPDCEITQSTIAPVQHGHDGTDQTSLAIVTCADSLTTMTHKKFNSLNKNLKLGLSVATKKTVRSLAKEYMQSATYQQQLLHTPFHVLVYCFNGDSEYICMYHELSEADHKIVLSKKKKQVYGFNLSTCKASFLDLRKILIQSSFAKNSYTIEIPWAGLTDYQKLSITKTKCPDFNEEKLQNLGGDIDSQLATTLLGCPDYKKEIMDPDKFHTCLLLNLSVEDPLQITGWRTEESQKTKNFILSLKELLNLCEENSYQRCNHSQHHHCPSASKTTTTADSRVAENQSSNSEVIRMELPFTEGDQIVSHVENASKNTGKGNQDLKEQEHINTTNGTCSTENQENPLGTNNAEINRDQTPTPVAAWTKDPSNSDHLGENNLLSPKEPATSTPLPKKLDTKAATKQSYQSLGIGSSASKAKLKELGMVDGQLCTICTKLCSEKSTLQCYVCKRKAHYVCYKGINGRAISNTNFLISNNSLPNHKWFCNSCNNLTVEDIIQSIQKNSCASSDDVSAAISSMETSSSNIPNSQISKPLDSRGARKKGEKPDDLLQLSMQRIHKVEHHDYVTMDQVIVNSETSNTQSHFSDIMQGPFSPITDHAENASLILNLNSPNETFISSGSNIKEKMDLLLRQRQEDSKVMTEILNAVKANRETIESSMSSQPAIKEGTAHNHSFSSKLHSPKYCAPTYGIPQQSVKTTLKPFQTVVISKNIANSLSKGSNEIKREFNKLFKGVPIEHCFASKGGSIFIELADKETARNVADNWKETYFTDTKSGTRGTICTLLSSIQNSVIVKQVPITLEEDYIADSIREFYPGAQVKRFVKAGNVKLRTVKIDFDVEGQSARFIKEGLRIENVVYPAEMYRPRQRVIQCFHCYKFGHVAKFCHQKKPTCPLCAGNHYQDECDLTKQLCCNCGSTAHYATNKDCPKFKAVLGIILDHYQNDDIKHSKEQHYDL